MESSRKKQFISFKLLTILSSVIKSHGILLLPAQKVDYPFAKCIHAIYAAYCEPLNSCLSY